MLIEELAQREKDIARALYVQLVTGRIDGYAFELVREMRSILNEIETKLSFRQLGGDSDLEGLAKRENL